MTCQSWGSGSFAHDGMSFFMLPLAKSQRRSPSVVCCSTLSLLSGGHFFVPSAFLPWLIEKNQPPLVSYGRCATTELPAGSCGLEKVTMNLSIATFHLLFHAVRQLLNLVRFLDHIQGKNVRLRFINILLQLSGQLE